MQGRRINERELKACRAKVSQQRIRRASAQRYVQRTPTRCTCRRRRTFRCLLRRQKRRLRQRRIITASNRKRRKRQCVGKYNKYLPWSLGRMLKVPYFPSPAKKCCPFHLYQGERTQPSTSKEQRVNRLPNSNVNSKESLPYRCPTCHFSTQPNQRSTPNQSRDCNYVFKRKPTKGHYKVKRLHFQAVRIPMHFTQATYRQVVRKGTANRRHLPIDNK